MPVGFDVDDVPHDGLEFARRRGYSVANSDDVKVADLRATEHTWPALEAVAAERSGGYQLIWWSDVAPDQHVADLVVLLTRFLGEIPLGEMDLRPQAWTVERLRQVEARRRAVGRRTLYVAAVAPDGHLAGYTNLDITDGTSERAEIDSTLVLPEHRGHRLGLALKVRLHQLTRELFPDTERLVTGNAGA